MSTASPPDSKRHYAVIDPMSLAATEWYAVLGNYYAGLKSPEPQTYTKDGKSWLFYNIDAGSLSTHQLERAVEILSKRWKMDEASTWEMVLDSGIPILESDCRVCDDPIVGRAALIGGDVEPRELRESNAIITTDGAEAILDLVDLDEKFRIRMRPSQARHLAALLEEAARVAEAWPEG